MFLWTLLLLHKYFRFGKLLHSRPTINSFWYYTMNILSPYWYKNTISNLHIYRLHIYIYIHIFVISIVYIDITSITTSLLSLIHRQLKLETTLCILSDSLQRNDQLGEEELVFISKIVKHIRRQNNTWNILTTSLNPLLYY